jgi:copper chaperone
MKMETVRLNVQGMTCGGCVASVTRVLKATPGVSDAQVTLQPGVATVTFDPAAVQVPQLKTAIVGAGFDVAG